MKRRDSHFPQSVGGVAKQQSRRRRNEHSPSNSERFAVDARTPFSRLKHQVGVLVDWSRPAGVDTLLAPLAQEWDVGRWSIQCLQKPAKDQAWLPGRRASLVISKQRHLPLHQDTVTAS